MCLAHVHMQSICSVRKEQHRSQTQLVDIYPVIDLRAAFFNTLHWVLREWHWYIIYKTTRKWRFWQESDQTSVMEYIETYTSLTFSFQIFLGIRLVMITYYPPQTILNITYSTMKLMDVTNFSEKIKRITNNIIHQYMGHIQKVVRIINISQNFFLTATGIWNILPTWRWWHFTDPSRKNELNNLRSISVSVVAKTRTVRLYLDPSGNSKNNIQPPVGHACIVNWGSCF